MNIIKDKEFNIEVRGVGLYFETIIEFEKQPKKNISVLKLCKKLNKYYNIPEEVNTYMYVILKDDYCGFIPLPFQTLEELYELYGFDNKLVLKITDKIFYG